MTRKLPADARNQEIPGGPTPAPTAHYCKRGHPHHSAQSASRCDQKTDHRKSHSTASSILSVSSVSSMSSKGSAGTVSPNRTSAATPTRAQPLSVGNLSAFHASESGGSLPGPRPPIPRRLRLALTLGRTGVLSPPLCLPFPLFRQKTPSLRLGLPVLLSRCRLPLPFLLNVFPLRP